MTDKPNLADARRVAEFFKPNPRGWMKPQFFELPPEHLNPPRHGEVISALLAVVDAVLAECDGEIDMHSRHRELTSLDPDHRPCESASRARFARRIRGAITAHLDIEEQQ